MAGELETTAPVEWSWMMGIVYLGDIPSGRKPVGAAPILFARASISGIST